MIDAAEHTIGLRFDHRDAGRLLRVGQRLLADGRQLHDVQLFALAAKAANDREPLVVQCVDPAEAQRMADGFTLHGVERPIVAELSGS